MTIDEHVCNLIYGKLNSKKHRSVGEIMVLKMCCRQTYRMGQKSLYGEEKLEYLCHSLTK